jgi:hypothetical protein
MKHDVLGAAAFVGVVFANDLLWVGLGFQLIVSFSVLSVLSGY